MTVGVVILAAGSGTRAQTDVPKQYVALGGVAVLRRAIDAFLRHPDVDHVQVVIAKGDEAHYKAATKGLELPTPVFGGTTRQESVLMGLEALVGLKADITLIHDGARPFPSTELISGIIDKVKHTAAGAIPALPVSDTLKKAVDGTIEATIDRHGLWQAQTPQGFPLKDIIVAHHKAIGQSLTDDAAIAEAAGISVHICNGSIDNIKITGPDDFKIAEAHLNGDIEETRTGFGVDVHRLVDAGDKKGVTLCGVLLPFDQTLEGHSDADVALHALTDALLGAIAKGDIGDHFPPTSKKWQDAKSEIFLKHAQKLLSDVKGRIINIDITIICEAPKIAPYRAQMRQALSDMLTLPLDRISVKATTSEKLGFMGRGEGILAEAVVNVGLPRA